MALLFHALLCSVTVQMCMVTAFGFVTGTVGVFCFLAFVSFNVQNKRGIVNESLFPVHLQDLLVSVGVKLCTE